MYNGVTFDADEALCLSRDIFLKCFEIDIKISYIDLLDQFLHDDLKPHYESPYDNWCHHLLSTMQQNWLIQQNLELFAHVHDHGAALDNFWGFVDGHTLCCKTYLVRWSQMIPCRKISVSCNT